MKKIKILPLILASMVVMVQSCDQLEQYELPEANSIADATPPSAGFAASPTEDYLTYNFANTSISATTYAWSFGDGSSATTKDASHTYAAEGSYTVTLTATDKLGVVSTSTGTVDVIEPEVPAAIIPEIINGDFSSGTDDWKIASFTGGTTNPFNSSSDGSSTNYDGTEYGSKTGGAKWTQSTSAGIYLDAPYDNAPSARYGYQAILVSPNVAYFLEFDYAIKNDTGSNDGAKIVVEILDGHFTDGIDAVASSNAGPILRAEGDQLLGKGNFTTVRVQFTSNATGEIAIWMWGQTTEDAYADNVKVYPVD